MHKVYPEHMVIDMNRMRLVDVVIKRQMIHNGRYINEEFTTQFALGHCEVTSYDMFHEAVQRKARPLGRLTQRTLEEHPMLVMAMLVFVTPMIKHADDTIELLLRVFTDETVPSGCLVHTDPILTEAVVQFQVLFCPVAFT